MGACVVGMYVQGKRSLRFYILYRNLIDVCCNSEADVGCANEIRKILYII